MVVEREIIVSVKASDGRKIDIGDTVVFCARGYTHVGVFMGFGNIGVLRFKGITVHGIETLFNVMPNTIISLLKCDIQVRDMTEVLI